MYRCRRDTALINFVRYTNPPKASSNSFCVACPLRTFFAIFSSLASSSQSFSPSSSPSSWSAFFPPVGVLLPADCVFNHCRFLSFLSFLTSRFSFTSTCWLHAAFRFRLTARASAASRSFWSSRFEADSKRLASWALSA